MVGLKPGNLGVPSSFLSVVVCVVARSCLFKCKNWLTFRGGSLFESADTSFRVLVSVVYCDVTEQNRVTLSRHRHNVDSCHYDGSRRCCYSGIN
jgi:hypothetical protein